MGRTCWKPCWAPRENPQSEIYEESSLFVNLAFSAEKSQQEVPGNWETTGERVFFSLGFRRFVGFFFVFLLNEVFGFSVSYACCFDKQKQFL